MSADLLLTTALIGLVTSFVGSFLALLIWIHWHLEDHWAERKLRIERERWARTSDGQKELERHPG